MALGIEELIDRTDSWKLHHWHSVVANKRLGLDAELICLGLLKDFVDIATVSLATWKVELEGLNSVLIPVDSPEKQGKAGACFPVSHLKEDTTAALAI